ncbi:MAG: hypothetical protein CFK52_11985 [Chloracidobacterium sp. CP2_5A]|nr:MAG: hypothetical protein CFK52_11985 [Chloracidobacterium sp. CP2_5A]
MSRYRYLAPVMNRRVRRPLDWRRLFRWSAAGVIGAALATGFGFAAWQQVEAQRLRYDANALRQQLTELDRERERLEVARQQKISPPRLSDEARRRNFRLPSPSQMGRMERR